MENRDILFNNDDDDNAVDDPETALNDDGTNRVLNLFRSQKAEAFVPKGDLISDQNIFVSLHRN